MMKLLQLLLCIPFADAEKMMRVRARAAAAEAKPRNSPKSLSQASIASGETSTAEGTACDTSSDSQACGGAGSSDLICSCLALNRGLHVCMRPGLISAHVDRERKGLLCQPVLPSGLTPMAAPPLLATARHNIVDPRAGSGTLAEWARGPGRNYYTQYINVGSADIGVPVLAGSDVNAAYVRKAADTLHHMFFNAMHKTTVAALSRNGVRLVIAGKGDEASDEGKWLKHPEISREFKTGLGGGAPWFPSTGVHGSDRMDILVEEMFHTIQYVAFAPQDVCMYHKAYGDAVAAGLYTSDNSGDEVDGEPVPTVQADEYLAMALNRWLGSTRDPKEYLVHGNSLTEGGPTGRESLQKQDPPAFCLIASKWKADDAWSPDLTMKPWRTNPNRGIDAARVASYCRPVMARLAEGCPGPEVTWPTQKRASERF